MSLELRDFSGSDGEAVNRVALAAFQQYRSLYTGWEEFARRISGMAALAESAEIVVASLGGRIVGAVAYVAPGKPRASFFAPEWSVLRMLVVEPASRGRGLGRALANECLRRARRDGAAFVALHTSPIMEVALALYASLGFEQMHAAPPIHGVPYNIYLKPLAPGAIGNKSA